MNKDWRERFDKEFYELTKTMDGQDRPRLKLFFEAAILSAAEAMRQRCEETVRNSRTIDERYGVGIREDTARMQAVVALRALTPISTNEDTR